MAEFDVVVVGAGFSGIYLLKRLKALGLRARCLERGGGVGGTWYFNRYPGARCDVETFDYQYSDSELAKEWTWSEKFATQPEILRYLEHAAKRWEVLGDIEFNTELLASAWDDVSSRWTLQTSRGTRLVARFFVMATGCLSCPHEPNFKGMDLFQGRLLSTSRWPHEALDFGGQRVAVIGTGSSAVQSAPMIAAQASQLFVLQRTPTYSVPANHSPPDPFLNELVSERWDEYRKLLREHPAGGSILRHGPWFFQAAASQKPQHVKDCYEDAWQRTGLGFGLQFRDTAVDPKANEIISDFVRTKISEVVSDAETAALLKPSYSFACKRPCVDSGYYDMYNRPNVKLIDIKGKTLDILADGIRVGEEKIEVDVIVSAIGFDAMTGSLLKPEIRGIHGKTLKEHWKDGPTNFLGLQVAGFPNLFTVTGPGSPSVLTNMVISIEQHVDWIVECMSSMQGKGASVIEALPASEVAWVQTLRDEVKPMVFNWGCDNSWYQGANISGKPRVFMPYAGGVGKYRAVCEAEAANGYPGFVLRTAEGRIVKPTLLQSLLSRPRHYAYIGCNLAKVLRMLWSRGGKRSLVGAAWPDAMVRQSQRGSGNAAVGISPLAAVILASLAGVYLAVRPKL